MNKLTLIGNINCALFSLFAFNAIANEHIQFNGFATIAAGQTVSNGKSNFGSDNTFVVDVPNQGMYNSELSFKEESLFGLQVIANLQTNFSFVGQFTAAAPNDYNAEATWAYLKYQAANDSSVLIGKQRVPLFFYSDSIDVGYSYHWIRPPTEATGGIMNEFVGILGEQSYLYQGWNSRFTLYYGAAEDNLKQFGETDVDDLWGVVLHTANDWLQVRATYAGQDLALNSGKFSSYGKVHNDENPIDMVFWGIASRADIDNWFVEFEYTSVDFNEAISIDQFVGTTGSDGWYLSTGYQYQSITYHVTYHAVISPISEDVGLVIQDTFQLPSAPFTTEQDTGSTAWTVGMRWDFHSNAALKIEYTERDENTDAEYLSFFGPSREVSVISAGLDLVF